jgi:hypothetical protein
VYRLIARPLLAQDHTKQKKPSQRGLRFTALRDVMSYSPIDRYQRVGRTVASIFRVEAAGSRYFPRNIGKYQTTQLHTPEDNVNKKFWEELIAYFL